MTFFYTLETIRYIVSSQTNQGNRFPSFVYLSNCFNIRSKYSNYTLLYNPCAPFELANYSIFLLPHFLLHFIIILSLARSVSLSLSLSPPQKMVPPNMNSRTCKIQSFGVSLKEYLKIFINSFSYTEIRF